MAMLSEEESEPIGSEDAKRAELKTAAVGSEETRGLTRLVNKGFPNGSIGIMCKEICGWQSIVTIKC